MCFLQCESESCECQDVLLESPVDMMGHRNHKTVFVGALDLAPNFRSEYIDAETSKRGRGSSTLLNQAEMIMVVLVVGMNVC